MNDPRNLLWPVLKMQLPQAMKNHLLWKFLFSGYPQAFRFVFTPVHDTPA
jgi:hypothetical protein